MNEVKKKLEQLQLKLIDTFTNILDEGIEIDYRALKEMRELLKDNGITAETMTGEPLEFLDEPVEGLEDFKLVNG